jgi:phosphoribosylanthranilate isomerase
VSLWIKICANTSLADAQLAVDAGADAVGFIFAPSPRRVTTDQVAAITPHLPASVEKIGVFVDAKFEAIAEAVRQAGLTGVQLHFEGDPTLPAQLRQAFGPDLRILRVLHFNANTATELQSVTTDTNIDGILIDSRTATAVGGTGIPFDWQAASTTIFSKDRRLKLVVAGGLNPGNVAEAIGKLQPWGVDVTSGVESSPRHKDPQKVRDFITYATAAAHKPGSGSGLLAK